MTTSEITRIQTSLGTKLPGPVREFLFHPEAIPSILRPEFFADACMLISRNAELRRGGYYHLPWKATHFAIGSDPGGCIYYFDLGDARAPAYFADHDYDDPADFKKLAVSPTDFVDYLVRLGVDFERQERSIR